MYNFGASYYIHTIFVSSLLLGPKQRKMAAPSGGGDGLLVSKLQSEKSGSIALARRAGRTRARALTRRYDFEKPSSTRSSSMNVNKGYVLGHTRARGRGRVWGGPSGSEFVLASLLACLAWLPTPAHSTHSPKHERYVRVYHFRARALQIYHPAREKRRKAIFVLLGRCSRRCSGQGWFHLHSSKFSLTSRCN